MLLVNGKYYGGMYRILWELHRELPQPTPALEFSLTQGHLQRCGFICLISSAIYCLLQTLDLFLIMTKKKGCKYWQWDCGEKQRQGVTLGV